MRLFLRSEFPARTAFARAQNLQSQISDGRDPMGERQTQRQGITLRELVEQRLARPEELSYRSRVNYAQLLDRTLMPEIGHLPASSITAEQIATQLVRIETRSKTGAHQVKSALSASYRWAAKRKLVTSNPLVGLGFSYQSPPRIREYTPDEVKAIANGIESAPGIGEAVRLVLMLTLLTGARLGEIVGSTKSELTLEGDRPVLRIEATHSAAGKLVEGRTKSKRAKVIPLSRQACEALRRAVELSGSSAYVFPADLTRTPLSTSGKRTKQPRTPHVNQQSVSRAGGKLRIAVGIDDVRVHDFRKIVATWLGEQGTDPVIIETVLGHAGGGITRTHYDFSRREPEVRAALQRWADHVDELIRPTQC